MAKGESCILKMQGITKDYFGTRVLKGIDLELKPGEIHGIVGENGAGKSTLMNILFGMPVIHSTGGYGGAIEVKGNPVSIGSPFDAMKLGIGMVHQEFMLIPGFSITENIKLNRELTKSTLFSKIFGPRLESLDIEAMGNDAKKALKSLDLGIDEWSKVAGLPVGHMQFIEIAREIDKSNIKVLVFDEPTAVLAESEAENLLKAVRKLAGEGVAILFITHRLHEIMAVCDRITVLRDGGMVTCVERTRTSMPELARLMVGRQLDEAVRIHPDTSAKPLALRIRNFSVDMPGETAKKIDLDVHEGEILGIGGLAGQGKIGIANGVMGLYPAKGEVSFFGKPLPLNNPKGAILEGLAFLSEDRRGVGLLLDMSIEMNIVSSAMVIQGKFLKKYGFFTQVDKAGVRRHALETIKNLDIRCKGPDQSVRRLSGGNQQKVCVAKALALDPKFLFVSEPTRGIDVGAKKLVLDTLVDLRDKLGLTIVMTSSELAELRTICDRIAIVNDGKIVGILAPNADDTDFGLMMAGDYDAR
ncbi:MAG: ribose transport system ATP-binding protein [Spirochaetes bacterium]|nr:MAG: ribose transport system ATP-binding protein [Spirochaetota bacterium]